MHEHKIMVSKPSSVGKGYALFAHALHKYTDSLILDSGASHHMTHCHELLPSTSNSSVSVIAIGDSKQLDVLGLGTVQIDNGYSNNVLLVPDISVNLLFIYQNCHGKTILFCPNDVVIKDLHNPKIIIATGKDDHKSRLYRFSHFEPPTGTYFIAHAYPLSKLWHERFGHVNYKYLQHLCS